MGNVNKFNIFSCYQLVSILSKLDRSMKFMCELYKGICFLLKYFLYFIYRMCYCVYIYIYIFNILICNQINKLSKNIFKFKLHFNILLYIIEYSLFTHLQAYIVNVQVVKRSGETKLVPVIFNFKKLFSLNQPILNFIYIYNKLEVIQ